MTNAEARFNSSLRPRKPEGSLGRTAQDGHLDSHTAPELLQFVDLLAYVLINESFPVVRNILSSSQPLARVSCYRPDITVMVDWV